MKNFFEFVKKDVVLVVAVCLAIISSFFVHPDKEYIGYIDFRTLAILFCLMSVMAGLEALGIFEKFARLMLAKASTVMGLAFVLIFMCFFSSMLITNDVALITFVPFTFTAFSMLGGNDKEKYIIPTVVLETIGANLGSMLTPIGNPQNLYLYGKSGMAFGAFILLMLPYAVISLILIVVTGLVIFKRSSCNTAKDNKNDVTLQKLSGETEESAAENQNSDTENKKTVVSQGVFSLTLTEMFQKSNTKYHSILIMYLLLFLVALLTVLRVLPFEVMLLITLILVVLADRKTLKKVDYSLLITFIGFFVFIGNMGRVPQISALLQKIVQGNEILVSVISSQAISNVPAALLLSGFTDNYKALIVGCDLGGLGTLIASMASLISYKMIAKEADISTGKYFKMFTILNVLFLIVLLLFAFIIA